jgi:hypothetical protein
MRTATKEEIMTTKQFGVMAACLLMASAALGQPGSIYGLKICHGQYALCAASTCTPTGGTIDVHVAGGGTASFPEAACTCPVFTGPAIADVTGGNMEGSCKPPGKGQVWSLYWPKTNIPQAVNDWSRKSSETEVDFQLCSSTDNVGATFANCFSFACTIDKKRSNGVKTATCYCPLGENPDGSAVPAGTAVLTPAGQCNPDACNEHPVGAAYSGANGQASECLGALGGSD